MRPASVSTATGMPRNKNLSLQSGTLLKRLMALGQVISLSHLMFSRALCAAYIRDGFFLPASRTADDADNPDKNCVAGLLVEPHYLCHLRLRRRPQSD